MEHRAIISKGVGCPINQKTAARSITRSFIRWQNLAQIRFWRAESGSDLQIPHCSLSTLFAKPLSPRRVFEPQYRTVFALGRKESNSTMEPWINHLAETETSKNNAWFSDCKSNYENPVNPACVSFQIRSYEVAVNWNPSVFDRLEYFYGGLIHCHSPPCWALFEQNVNLFSNYANFFYERCHTYFGGSGPVLRWFTL